MTEVNTTSQAAAATALNSSSKAPTTAAAASPNGKANTSSKTAGQRQTASVSSSKDSSSHNNNNTRNNNNNGNRSSSSKDTNSDSLGEIWFDTMRRNRGDTSTPSSPTNSSEQDGEGGNSSDCSSNSNHGNNADVIMTENNAVTKDNNNKNKYVDKMQPMSGLSDGGPEDKVQGGDNTNTSNNKDQDQAKASPVCNATDEHAAAALMAEAGNSKQKKRKHNEAAAAGGNHAAANNAAHPNNSGPKKAKVDSSSNKNGATANNTAGSTSKPTAPGANTGTGAGAATTSGYMSDDEGFNDREGADRDENVSNSVSDYNNYKDDSSGSSRNNLAAVVMAANALLEQHKQQDKQDQLDKDNRDQMELDEMEAVNVISAAKNDPVTTTAAVQQAAAAKPVTNSSPHNNNNNSSSNTNTKNKTADTTKRQQGSNAINKKKKVVIDVPQTQTQTQTSQPRGGVKKVGKRVERNAREKERSGKINDQFNELKDLLAQNGIVVPKGTKGSILGITHQYILALQQAQRQKEQDTFSLQQQVEAIAKGSMGSEASRALFHSAQKQGLALDPTMAPPGVFLASSPQQQEQQQQEVPSSPPVYNPLTSVGEADYPSVWHKCPAAMAMATLGGTFVDCNQVFCELLQCSKAELCQLSIFHLLNNNTADSGNNPGSTGCSKADLRFAFDQISQLLEKVNSKSGSGSSSSSGEDDGSGKSSVSSLSSSPSSPVALRGSVQGQEHLGLAISMIKSNAKDSGAKHHHLCVTITRRPLGDSNNSENKIIVPATLENVAGAASGGSMASPSTSSAASASTPGSFKKPHLQGLTATAPQYAIG